MGRRSNGLDVLLSIIRVLYFLFYVLFVAYIIYVMYDASISENALGGIGLAYALILILIGPMGFGILLVVGIISLILSLCNRNSDYYDKNKASAIWGILVPILSWGALFLYGVMSSIISF